MSWKEATLRRIQNSAKKKDEAEFDIKILSAMLDAHNKKLSKKPFIDYKFGSIYVVIGSSVIGSFSNSTQGEERAEELLKLACNVNSGVE